MNDLIQFTEPRLGNGMKMGRATLSSPNTLNALNLEIILALHQQLKIWQQNGDIAFIWLDSSEEKAFCAGGDIKHLAQSIHHKEPAVKQLVTDFFNEEYALDYFIHGYKKPIIAWGSGFIIGGGVGIYNGCSHRIVCENSIMMMPELKIGFFADVGASWFLNRLFANAGLLVGLTAMPLTAEDSLLHGLADTLIETQEKEKVFATLSNSDQWSTIVDNNHHLIDELLMDFSQNKTINFIDNPFIKHYDIIQNIARSTSISQAIQRIQQAGQHIDWFAKAAKALEQMSPFSSQVLLHQLQRSKHLSLKEVFYFERDIALNMMFLPDFYEGVRALLIDKDKNPRWQSQSVDEVSDELVVSAFKPVDIPMIF